MVNIQHKYSQFTCKKLIQISTLQTIILFMIFIFSSSSDAHNTICVTEYDMWQKLCKSVGFCNVYCCFMILYLREYIYLKQRIVRNEICFFGRSKISRRLGSEFYYMKMKVGSQCRQLSMCLQIDMYVLNYFKTQLANVDGTWYLILKLENWVPESKSMLFMNDLFIYIFCV